ncbi:hypothetical protein PUN4_310025 [Paraburkholderia unamae]|nr:hypothetical protein PUN4_310025 [Paraburkholderia unamae]
MVNLRNTNPRPLPAAASGQALCGLAREIVEGRRYQRPGRTGQRIARCGLHREGMHRWLSLLHEIAFLLAGNEGVASAHRRFVCLWDFSVVTAPRLTAVAGDRTALRRSGTVIRAVAFQQTQ